MTKTKSEREAKNEVRKRGEKRNQKERQVLLGFEGVIMKDITWAVRAPQNRASTRSSLESDETSKVSKDFVSILPYLLFIKAETIVSDVASLPSSFWSR